MTDAELDVASARMARLLERRGLGPGDRVGVMLPNVPEFAVAYLEGYGLSQTSPVASFNHPDRERKPGSIGTPIQGVEMKAVDEARHEVAQGDVGEIAIPGHNVMKSHWARPEATAEAIDGHGWFYTGDIARVDEDGYFFIVDRKKELIIRGGYNVYPREIEEVLYEHPAVLEAAVIGVPHAELGEEGARRSRSYRERRWASASCATISRARSRPTSTRATASRRTSATRRSPGRRRARASLRASIPRCRAS
jgi:long-chain acyl-CoA synthetase